MRDAGTVPVAVDVAGPRRSQLLRVVEGSLGWQVVSVDDPVLPPRCVFVDVTRAAAHDGGATPAVLVTGVGDEPVAAARAARHVVEVLDDVPDAAALRGLVGRLATVDRAGRRPWCSVAAAAGGVGATTVATALAGLRAWHHGPTLLAVAGPSHQERAPAVAAAELAGPVTWTAAAPAVGLEDLRVVRLRDRRPPPDAGPVPLVVEGADVTTADVVVCRPDRAGCATAGAASGAVVVVGRGPVQPSIGEGRDRPVVAVPWSARVAAAAAACRMPTDLPGAWLQPLVGLVGWLEERAAVAGT